jgi:hypothetical protein
MSICANTTYSLKISHLPRLELTVFNFRINACLRRHPLVYRESMDVEAKCNLHLCFAVGPRLTSRKYH